jgi:hypothetical protein
VGAGEDREVDVVGQLVPCYQREYISKLWSTASRSALDEQRDQSPREEPVGAGITEVAEGVGVEVAVII